MALAHRLVSIAVYGPTDTIIRIPALYCSGDARGERVVKAAVRKEADKQGIELGRWEYLSHDDRYGWEGRVYGQPAHPVKS